MKLALAQMLVEPGGKAANLARAEARIAEAAAQGAEIVVLPEAMPLGWTDPSARDEADAIPHGESCARLRAAARANHMFVCSGVIERCGDNIYNAAVLIAPDGEVMLHHRKIHELEIAHDLYACGDRLGVAETPWGKVGLMICADGFAPGQAISRSLAMMGARVILSPCAWAVPADHDNARDPYGALWLDNYGAVTRDFDVTFVGVSNVGPIHHGPWRGRKCIGNSLIVGPRGELLRGPYGDTADALIVASL